MNKGLINQYKNGTYNFNTDLTATQINDLISKAKYILIDYVGLNKGCIEQKRLDKSNTDTYTISDLSISSAEFNVRLSKIIMTITSSGVQITSNKCSQIIYSDGTPTFNHLSSEDVDSNSQNFIQIRGIRIICDI